MPEQADSARGAAGTATAGPDEAPLVFALDRWDPGRGGLEGYAAALLRGLAARGVPLVLVCGHATVEPPVPWIELGAVGPAFYAALDERVGFAADAQQLEARRLVCFRHPGPRCRVFLPLGGLLASSLAARRAVEPWGLRGARRLARSLSPRTRAFLARERSFFAEASAEALVVANSPVVAAEIARRHPGFRGRVEVVGLPVDDAHHVVADAATRREARRALLGLDDDRPVLLWVGNERRRKGWRVARAVHARLRQRRLEAMLLCTGAGTEDLDDEAAGVIGLGRVADMRGPYRCADVLLVPSLEDNYPLVVLEALATGVPVVLSARCGNAALLTDPAVGRVVADPRDVDGFDRHCLALLERGMLDAGRMDARRRAVEPCFLGAHLDRMQDLLETATCRRATS
ncbi:MAG: glycosyltransferase family 4 protein [Planctomycetota bacterium]